jgi:hypothetical protein
MVSSEAWRSLLGAPRPGDHVIQLLVERAYRDVSGAGGDAATLRRLMVSHRTAGLEMPAAQAALLVLRGVREDVADAVLARAGYYYSHHEGAT